MSEFFCERGCERRSRSLPDRQRRAARHDHAQQRAEAIREKTRQRVGLAVHEPHRVSELRVRAQLLAPRERTHDARLDRNRLRRLRAHAHAALRHRPHARDELRAALDARGSERAPATGIAHIHQRSRREAAFVLALLIARQPRVPACECAGGGLRNAQRTARREQRLARCGERTAAREIPDHGAACLRRPLADALTARALAAKAHARTIAIRFEQLEREASAAHRNRARRPRQRGQFELELALARRGRVRAGRVLEAERSARWQLRVRIANWRGERPGVADTVGVRETQPLRTHRLALGSANASDALEDLLDTQRNSRRTKPERHRGTIGACARSACGGRIS